MAIFESFLKSPHLLDEGSWNGFFLFYYGVHGSLCKLDIEPEETIPYLADYVEELKEHSIDEFISLINWVDEIYDSGCYSYLKDSHSCEDWMLLVKALQPLTPLNRKVLS
jgi:hypothetical protein